MQKSIKQASEQLKEYYAIVSYHTELRMTTFTEFKPLNEKFAVLHTLTGKPFTDFKVVPIRLYNQFVRLNCIRTAINEKRNTMSYMSYKQQQAIQSKFSRIFLELKTKINEWVEIDESIKIGDSIQIVSRPADSFYKQAIGIVQSVQGDRVSIEATKVVSKWSTEFKDHPSSCMMTAKLCDVILYK